MTGNSPLGSVDKALRALQSLGETGADGLPLTRLAAALGLNKASLHRTLSALRHRGFVEQDSTGNYRLGTAILALADSYLRDESLRRIFHEGLSELCGRINETCHLGVLVGEQIMYIDKVEPQRAIRIWSEIGWRNPAVSTALGRSILSQRFVDFESFSARFPSPIVKRTPHTRTTLRSVWQELLEARKRGFAIEVQENEPGVTCIATALLRGTDVIAAVSVTTPSDRMDEKSAAMVTRMLRECIEPHLPPGLSVQKPILGVPSRSARVSSKLSPLRKGHIGKGEISESGH
jgi:IclR family acetate operon transcriptional repressor